MMMFLFTGKDNHDLSSLLLSWSTVNVLRWLIKPIDAADSYWRVVRRVWRAGHWLSLIHI